MTVHTRQSDGFLRRRGVDRRYEIPHCSHHLPLYNGIAPVRAYTKVEIGLEFLVGNRVLDSQFLVVEIGLHDLVVEEEANILRGGCFFQQAFIKKRTANGVDALEGWDARTTTKSTQQKVISRTVYGKCCQSGALTCPSLSYNWLSCSPDWEWIMRPRMGMASCRNRSATAGSIASNAAIPRCDMAKLIERC